MQQASALPAAATAHLASREPIWRSSLLDMVGQSRGVVGVTIKTGPSSLASVPSARLSKKRPRRRRLSSRTDDRQGQGQIVRRCACKRPPLAPSVTPGRAPANGSGVYSAPRYVTVVPCAPLSAPDSHWWIPIVRALIVGYLCLLNCDHSSVHIYKYSAQ